MELLARLEKPTGDFVSPLFAGVTISALQMLLSVNLRATFDVLVDQAND